ncbi:phage tail protein [Schinkia sp. CFF1]
MGAFGGLVITNDGRNLQLKAQTGIQLKFTRIALGDGALNGASMSDLRNLISQKMSLNITKLKKETNRAVVGAVLSNQTLAAGFYFREIGVFATDPDIGEILYCYGNAGQNGEYVPAGGGSDVIEKTIDVSTIVGNAVNVSATIDQSLVFMSKGPLTWNQIEGIE